MWTLFDMERTRSWLIKRATMHALGLAIKRRPRAYLILTRGPNEDNPTLSRIVSVRIK